MSSNTDMLFYAAGGSLMLALAIVSFLMASTQVAQASSQGARGYQRQLMRDEGLFSFFEPALLLIAGWVSWLPLGGARRQLEVHLVEAGHYLGLSPDEFIALSMLYGGVGGLFAMMTFPAFIPFLMLYTLAAMVPYLKLSALRDKRTVAVTRSLPTAIELIALCVSAGMDFPGALREVIGDSVERDNVLNSEFRLILRDLDLGHSRKDALRAFDARSKGEGVSDLVAALIQSEEKGNPLRGVLTAQAKVLHVRRTFRAEEMATKAGLKMVIPLAILMFMLLIIIITPLMLRVKEQGF